MRVRRAVPGDEALLLDIRVRALTDGLHVVQDNARAIRVCERHGFRQNGRTHVRERDGALEIEMARPAGTGP